MPGRLARLLPCILVAIAVLNGAPCRACTTFCIAEPGATVVGKNYDWHVGDGIVLVNARGVTRTAMVSSGRPATWVSRHGSVTFNQFGVSQPCGGMNEAGLVVELMWLDGTRYPPPDARPTVSCLGFIQHALDTCATLDEVLATAAAVRIVDDVPLHYMACDASGACATIEFLDGKLVTHAGADLPVRAMTNHPSADALVTLRSYLAFGGTKPQPKDAGSMARFARAATLTRRAPTSEDPSAVERAFDVLHRVANGDYTTWSIVHDSTNRRISFRSLAARSVKSIDLRALDFACGAPLLSLDVNTKASGDVTRSLAPHSTASYRRTLGRVFERIDFLADTPASVLDALARPPDPSSCDGN